LKGNLPSIEEIEAELAGDLLVSKPKKPVSKKKGPNK